MAQLKNRVFACDFETTVYKGQQNTEVWSSACVELFTEDVSIFHSIGEQFDYFVSLKTNVLAYYHNLKFDGAFWLSYLLVNKRMKQAYTQANPDDINTIHFMDRKEMPNDSFVYSISEMGQWYSITIKVHNKIIEIRDSLKLLPFSIKRIGDSFKTKHKKLEMDYEGLRYAGCTITEEEKEYIKNDVLVLKEALEIMYQQGHDKLTIGACCLSEFKKEYGKEAYNNMFPNLYEIEISEEYGSPTVGDYVHNAYHGGWCYLAKGKERRIINRTGTTADVNSLYPSMMSSESGNAYPYGKPTFWKGNIPDIAEQTGKYYFVRIETKFNIKKNKLPFIQIKNNLLYHPREMLETSDIKDRDTGIYYDSYIGIDGERKPAKVTLTMTMTDYKLFREHYNVSEFKILDGCYFDSAKGLFDQYIYRYKEMKLNNTGALRELAKLFLNNLYGKMAASTNSSFKVAFVKEDNVIGFYTVVAYEKNPGYIAIGAAITSYARNFTIRAAQLNYHGVNRRGFIYADTDSIHCDLNPDEIKGITVHDKNFCCWKLESCWDKAIFVRAKTYIEHVTHENLQPTEPYWNVKCAGMPENCKNLFIRSMEDKEVTEEEIEKNKWGKDQIDFLSTKRDLSDFDIGLVIPGKLRPKRILGGILLEETTYMMREI